MANSASLQLFELISSMSRSEKRYFKIYIRTHASKHERDYVDLFQLVEQQDRYDEAAVVEKIQSKGPTQRFAVLKHRLFEKILDALESYQRSKDERMRLRHEINRAQVLLKRGMFRVGFSLLRKVEQQALGIEAYESALEARALHAKYADQQVNADSYSTSEVSDTLEHIALEHKLIEIRSRVEDLLRQYGRSSVDREQLSVLESLISNMTKGSESSARSMYLSHHVMGMIEFAKNNVTESLTHLKRCQSLLKEHDYLSIDMPLAEADLWANETYCHLMLEEEDAAKKSLLNLMDIDQEALGSHQKLEYQGDLMQSLLFYLNKTNDDALIENLQENIEQYQNSRWEHPPLIRAGIDYGLGLFYHDRGDNGRALRCLNKVLNDGEVKRDEDIYHRTLVLITFLHAESGDRSWMVHSARALKRYLTPRNLLHGTDELLLEYISDFRRSRSEEGEFRAVQRFAEGLRAIRQNMGDQIAFEHFDFLAWAEDQLENFYQANKVA